ncbi:MAG: Flp pilus assembly complex ATPase component TadA [Phycisphaerae bacterium]|nr:Flp pilus assembly complex ATPase component TadA [Phycisphaerae bacterium]
MNVEMLAESVELGGYICIWKLITFVVLFGFWAWIGQWLDKDAKAVNTNRSFWNNIYMGAGTLIFALWFLLPAPFLVVLPMFLVIWATVTIIYILHRNARVPDNKTILTRDHIRWVLSSESRGKVESNLRLEFISVNDNELPTPHKMDDEYYGYVLAEELIYDLWMRRVSHARIIPQGEEYKVQYVIDGIASIENELDREDAEAAIKYLKAVAGLDTKDRRRPQTGSFFTIKTSEEKTTWNIFTSGSTRGEELSLERVEKAHVLSLAMIGLHDKQLKQVEQEILKPQGVVLVTGMPKSGVTTSLYSFIRRHDAFTHNIYSLEMKTLSDLDNITQNLIDVGPDAPSHARQLQTAFHSDPDTMLVGFCDEPDMAKMGTKAAISGKKLYFGMEANGVLDALKRWMEMVGDNKKVAKTLLMITNQKILRKLCFECREAYTPDANTLKKLNLPVGKVRSFYRPPTELLYDKKGNPILCENCQGTGYFGRTAVFETLILSDALKALIAESASWDALRTQCRKERMLYLQEQALRKVIEGDTSIKEVLRITTNQKAKKNPVEK